MEDLSGYTGLVTGASGGIGLAIATFLAECGASVYCISRTGKPKDQDIQPAGGIHHLRGDICDQAAMGEIIRSVGDSQGLDFLINNAGITIKKPAQELTPEEFDQVQQVNVSAPFRLSVLAYPYLRRSPRTGRIINISSMAAHLGFSLVVPYCASKSAVLGLTRGLAVEWANDNITVNSIAPGWYPSEMSRQVMDEKRKAQILGRMPVHRFGDTRDLGAMAAFLLSDSARYITGVDYAVDGGALAYGF